MQPRISLDKYGYSQMQDFENLNLLKSKALCALLGFFYADMMMHKANERDYVSLSAFQLCGLKWLSDPVQKETDRNGTPFVRFSLKKLHELYNEAGQVYGNDNPFKMIEGVDLDDKNLPYLDLNVEVDPDPVIDKSGKKIFKPYDTNVLALVKAVPFAIMCRHQHPFATQNIIYADCFLMRTSIYNADYEQIYVSILKGIIDCVPIDVIVQSLKGYGESVWYLGEEQMKQYYENPKDKPTKEAMKRDEKFREDLPQRALNQLFVDVKLGRVFFSRPLDSYSSKNALNLVVAVLCLVSDTWFETEFCKSTKILLVNTADPVLGKLGQCFQGVSRHDQIKDTFYQEIMGEIMGLKHGIKGGSPYVAVVGAVVGAFVGNAKLMNKKNNDDKSNLYDEFQNQEVIRQMDKITVYDLFNKAYDQTNEIAILLSPKLECSHVQVKYLENENLKIHGNVCKHYVPFSPFNCEGVPSQYSLQHYLDLIPKSRFIAKFMENVSQDYRGLLIIDTWMKKIVEFIIQKDDEKMAELSRLKLDEEKKTVTGDVGMDAALLARFGAAKATLQKEVGDLTIVERHYVNVFAILGHEKANMTHTTRLRALIPYAIFCNSEVRQYFGLTLDIFGGHWSNNFKKFKWVEEEKGALNPRVQNLQEIQDMLIKYDAEAQKRLEDAEEAKRLAEEIRIKAAEAKAIKDAEELSVRETLIQQAALREQIRSDEEREEEKVRLEQEKVRLEEEARTQLIRQQDVERNQKIIDSQREHQENFINLANTKTKSSRYKDLFIIISSIIITYILFYALAEIFS